MKILMLCPQFRPLTGGYERAAEVLSAVLAVRGHKVTVVTERRDRAWKREELLSGFRIRRLSCWYRKGWHGVTARTSLGLWLVRHGRSFDVWHVHQYGAPATLAVVLGKLLRRPVVLKLTSSGVEQGLAASVSALRWGGWHRWAHRQASGCVAVSQESAAEARAFGIPNERIHCIANGVDMEILQPASPEQRADMRIALGLGTAFLAVAVGRLSAEKNPLGVLAAWQRALPALPAGACLAWVGDGPERAAVDLRMRGLGIEGSVVLVGHSESVASWLAAADLFVLPSQYEGMANALLEAMACGLPSVATAVSGVSQLLGVTGAGRVVPVGDMAAFADAIVAMARDAEARTSMGRRARQVIEAGYSIDSVASQMEAVYEHIATAD